MEQDLFKSMGNYSEGKGIGQDDFWMEDVNTVNK